MERSKLIRLVVLVALGAALAAALGAFAFIKSGLYNVAASKPHTTFTFWVTEETMQGSVQRNAAKSVIAPARFTPAQVAAGFCAYRARCAACHGAAGVPRQRWAAGMEPAPPYLLDATHKFTRAELFWIVKNGIKMTGMPSWRAEMTDAEIWATVAWLEASAKLPPQTYARWSAERRCEPATGVRPSR